MKNRWRIQWCFISKHCSLLYCLDIETHVNTKSSHGMKSYCHHFRRHAEPLCNSQNPRVNHCTFPTWISGRFGPKTQRYATNLSSGHLLLTSTERLSHYFKPCNHERSISRTRFIRKLEKSPRSLYSSYSVLAHLLMFKWSGVRSKPAGCNIDKFKTQEFTARERENKGACKCHTS